MVFFPKKKKKKRKREVSTVREAFLQGKGKGAFDVGSTDYDFTTTRLA